MRYTLGPFVKKSGESAKINSKSTQRNSLLDDTTQRNALLDDTTGTELNQRDV